MTELSPWYELVSGDGLAQGDIFENCPVFRPPASLELPSDEGATPEVEFEVEHQDLVLMTQTCDLVPGQKSDMKFAVMCPLWPLSEIEKVNQTLRASVMKEECRRGHMPGLHMLAGCDHVSWRREVSVVTFREILSLPISLVRSVAGKSRTRVRLRSPYREHLAQAFARFFMRVGLPSDITPFQSDNAERDVIRRLRSLDPDVRQRVIAASEA